MKIRCCCCGRQIILNSYQSDRYIAPGMSAKVGIRPGEGFCDECGYFLDENGLFPEERGQAAYLYKIGKDNYNV